MGFFCFFEFLFCFVLGFSEDFLFDFFGEVWFWGLFWGFCLFVGTGLFFVYFGRVFVIVVF